MVLQELLSALPQGFVNSDVLKSIDTCECLDLTLDSREVKEGSLFLAVNGFESDGRNYIESAVSNGASAIIYEAIDLNSEQESLLTELSAKLPCIAVADLRSQVSTLAAQFFNKPSEELQVYGVTGTNGKTSCAFMLAQAFNFLGFKTAFMGTIGVGNPTDLQTTTHTTLDAVSLQRYLASLLDQGFTHACIEVSSHALDQARVAAVNFYAVLHTNLSQDHLDYHQTMAAYAAAKKRLFTEFDATVAVLNASDEFGRALVEQANAEFVVTYGKEEDGADVFVEEVQANEQGLLISVATEGLDFDVQSQILGLVNVPNINLVIATLLALGVEIDDIQQSVQHCVAAPGRMELYAQQGKPKVVVDFAHTPEALKLALESSRIHCQGNLWVVFGCGGDRDKSKRALMGAAAEQYADKVIVSDDNPRSESSDAIIQAIIAGMKDMPVIIENRQAAVAYAIDHAEVEDLILVAGKGHETGQIIGDEVLPYSDRAWVQECLEAAA